MPAPTAMKWGETLLMFGFIGIGSTCFALFWAPSVSLDAFESPAAQRIFYWHVPPRGRRSSPLAPCSWVPQAGCFGVHRGHGGFTLPVQAGLATGLMTVWSGCVWGAAEWGTPWIGRTFDSTLGLLTLLAIYVVLGETASPTAWNRGTRSPPSAFTALLVPVTYIAIIWTIRHPGPVVATGDEGSINGDMGLVLLLGAISFTVFIVGHMMASMRLTALEQRVTAMMDQHDGGA